MINVYPTFQTEVLDPYPHLNGGQQLGARGLSVHTVTFISTLFGAWAQFKWEIINKINCHV